MAAISKSIRQFDPADYTLDDFLGGKIRLYQPRNGYRVAMDSILLAASVPARAGDRVMEPGMGSAGAALALAARVPEVCVTGIERRADMVSLAQQNIVENGFGDRVNVLVGDIRTLEGRAGTYDHVFINPPFLADGQAIRPPTENKGRAHMEHETTLKDWIRIALYHCRHKGTISLIYRADRLDELISRLYGRVGDLHILPLLPREGERAKRVIVQGRKGTRGASQLLTGLILHGREERYSNEARRLLWDGQALNLKKWDGTSLS